MVINFDSKLRKNSCRQIHRFVSNFYPIFSWKLQEHTSAVHEEIIELFDVFLGLRRETKTRKNKCKKMFANVALSIFDEMAT